MAPNWGQMDAFRLRDEERAYASSLDPAPIAGEQPLYSVYVIELSDERGPRRNPRYPNVYVGQSALSPEERFSQHRLAYKASRRLWKGGKGSGQWLGLWLRPRLYERYNPIPTRTDAEEKERWLAEHLRTKGYTVFTG